MCNCSTTSFKVSTPSYTLLVNEEPINCDTQLNQIEDLIIKLENIKSKINSRVYNKFLGVLKSMINMKLYCKYEIFPIIDLISRYE